MSLKNQVKPSVSVLTTLYNHEKFIREALESALSQTLQPDEIVVMDDASSDESVKVARGVQHSTIHVYSESMNLGGPNTMRGLELCHGTFLAVLNSDDVWLNDKLRKQVSYLENHPECGAVFTYVNLIDENGTSWSEGTNRHQAFFQTKNRDRYEWLRYFFFSGNPFCASSAVIRRECFDQLGPFDGRYVQLQDLDMWIRIVMHGYDVHIIQEPLTKYRVMRDGSNMSSSTLSTKSLYTFEYSKILRNFWKIKSLTDLKKVFPELQISADADDSLVLFYLAIHASKQATVQHQLFALETMSYWGGNIKRMQVAHKCHGFGLIDYRKFLSNGPIRDLQRRGVRNRLETFISRFLPFHWVQILKAVLLRFVTSNK